MVLARNIRKPSSFIIQLIVIGSFLLGALVSISSKPEYIVAFVIIILLSLVLFIWPITGCFIIIAATLITSGAPRGWPFPLLRLNELVLGGVFLIYMVRRLLVTIIDGKLPHFTIIDGAFALWFITSGVLPAINMFINGNPFSSASFLVLFAPLQYYVLYRILVDTLKTESSVRTCIWTWLITGALVSIIGLLQALRIQIVMDMLTSWFPSEHVISIDSGLLRATSVFGNWHAFAAFLVFQVIVTVTFLIFRHESRLTKSIWPLAGILSISLIVFIPVVSTAGIIGLLLSLGLLLWFSPIGARKNLFKLQFLLLIIFAAGLVYFWPFVSDRLQFQFGSGHGLVPATFQERLRIWQYVLWPEIREHFLFGSGLTIPDYLGIRTEESYFGFLLLRGGIIAFSGFIISAGILLSVVYSIAIHSRGLLRPLAVAALVIIIVTLVMNISNAYWIYSGIAETIWIFIALVVVLNNNKQLNFYHSKL